MQTFLLHSDTAALTAERSKHPLVPAYFYRRLTRLRLTHGEVHLFDELRKVKHHSLLGDMIAGATHRPTVASFRRFLAHLASQCNDSPRVVGDVVGEYLALMLRAQGALYRLDQTDEGVATADLRHVRVGCHFRVSLTDHNVYRIVESTHELVTYIRTGIVDAVLRGYPKDEGPLNVYIVPTK